MKEQKLNKKMFKIFLQKEKTNEWIWFEGKAVNSCVVVCPEN